jgi:hypothetical protein
MQAASSGSAIGCLGCWFYRERASQITGIVEKYRKTIFNALHRIAVRKKIMRRSANSGRISMSG